jgi:NAD-dependent SIR2 family protein deacetylase
MTDFNKYIGKTLTFYCVKCRKKHPAKVEDVRKKGKAMLALADCPKCGTTMWRILGRA